MRAAQFRERASGDLWELANEYLGWFASECGFTPDEVYDMPIGALVALTMSADRQLDNAQPAPEPQWTAPGMRRPS